MTEIGSTRIRVPSQAAAGDTISVRCRLTHPMESGFRPHEEQEGETYPQMIVNRFTCRFNGRALIDVALEPFVSEDPYFLFDMVARESGTFEFEWEDDAGAIYRTSAEMTVA